MRQTSGRLKSCLGSVNTCMMLTFLTLAHAKGLTPVGYESEAEGLLENVEDKYRITEVTVRRLHKSESRRKYFTGTSLTSSDDRIYRYIRRSDPRGLA